MPQLKNLDVEWVSLVDRAAVRDPSNPTEPQRFLLTKSEVPVWKADAGAPTTTPKGGNVPEAELRAQLEKAEGERDKLAKQVAKLQKRAKKAKVKKDDGKPTEPAKLDKSQLAPEVRAALEKAEKDAKETRERAEKAEKLAKAERRERVTQEFIAKAEAEFPHLGAASELGPRLMRMSETLSKEDYDAHVQELKAAEARIETGALFAELGKSGDPPPTGDEQVTIEAATRKAEELRKSDPNLTPYEAMHLAMSREDQARYLAAVRY